MNKRFIKYCIAAIVITYTVLFLDLRYKNNVSNNKTNAKENNKTSVTSTGVVSEEARMEIVSEGAYFTPCINSKGTKLLYSSGDNIYELDMKTKKVEQLTNLGNCYNPIYYQQDNTLIAFARNDGIYKMDLKTKKIIKMVFSENPEISFAKPNFTPEGDLIYFKVTVQPRLEGHGFLEKEPSIIRISKDGSKQEKIIEGYNPILSKDGRKLIYEMNNNIYLMDLNMKDSKLVDKGKYATWSNSGKYISYAKFDRTIEPYSKVKGKKNLFINKEYSNIYITDVNNLQIKKKLTKEEFDNKESDVEKWAKETENSSSEQHFLVVSRIAYFDSAWSNDDSELFLSEYNSDKEAFELVKYSGIK